MEPISQVKVKEHLEVRDLKDSNENEFSNLCCSL